MPDNFLTQLREEIFSTQQRRIKLTIIKITMVSTLLGFGNIKIKDITEFYHVLYLVPLVAVFFDMLIMGESYSIKRIGAFLRLASHEMERKYEEFVSVFKKYSKSEQYVLPYLISAFPGTTIQDAENMMYYLQRNNIRVEQVQDFIPLPMTIAAAMYYTEKNFFTGENIHVAKSYQERVQHRKLMQWWL